MNEKRMPPAERIANAKTDIRHAAEEVASRPNDDEAWRQLCVARATLRALARCAR